MDSNINIEYFLLFPAFRDECEEMYEFMSCVVRTTGRWEVRFTLFQLIYLHYIYYVGHILTSLPQICLIISMENIFRANGHKRNIRFLLNTSFSKLLGKAKLWCL